MSPSPITGSHRIATHDRPIKSHHCPKRRRSTRMPLPSPPRGYQESNSPAAPTVAAENPIENHQPIEINTSHVCDICGKAFSSGQALGGHKTAHRNKQSVFTADLNESKPHHKCSICGEEFTTGQALGGHKTAHRNKSATTTAVADRSASNPNSEEHIIATNFMNCPNSSVRRSLDLDLNEPAPSE